MQAGIYHKKEVMPVDDIEVVLAVVAVATLVLELASFLWEVWCTVKNNKKAAPSFSFFVISSFSNVSS